MTHPYYPFQTLSDHPYYPYTKGDERAGIDVPLPPWYGVFPLAAPLGALEWGSDFLHRNLGSASASPKVSSPQTDWSLLAKVGLVVGGAVGIYFIYRGIRTSAYMTRSAVRGALESDK